MPSNARSIRGVIDMAYRIPQQIHQLVKAAAESTIMLVQRTSCALGHFASSSCPPPNLQLKRGLGVVTSGLFTRTRRMVRGDLMKGD